MNQDCQDETMSATSQPAANDSTKTHNARLPIWALTPAEDNRARANLKKFAYKECDDFVKAMADCAKNHGIRVFPNCSEQRDKMKECLIFYQAPKYLDQQRDLIVLEKIERLEKQLAERKSKEQK